MKKKLDPRISAIVGILQKQGCVPRKMLCQMLGIKDRTLRNLVREARQKGIPICSKSQRKGYWLGTDEEIEKMIAEYRHRALDCILTAMNLSKRKSIGYQVDITDIMEEK